MTRIRRDWEEQLAWQCHAARLPPPVRELRFAPPRRWRFDLAWPCRGLAVEVDGGVYVQGRHSRGAGVEADCEKYAAAAARGYRVIRVTPRHVKDGRALLWIEQALAAGAMS